MSQNFRFLPQRHEDTKKKVLKITIFVTLCLCGKIFLLVLRHSLKKERACIAETACLKSIKNFSTQSHSVTDNIVFMPVFPLRLCVSALIHKLWDLCESGLAPLKAVLPRWKRAWRCYVKIHLAFNIIVHSIKNLKLISKRFRRLWM